MDLSGLAGEELAEAFGFDCNTCSEIDQIGMDSDVQTAGKTLLFCYLETLCNYYQENTDM